MDIKQNKMKEKYIKKEMKSGIIHGQQVKVQQYMSVDAELSQLLSAVLCMLPMMRSYWWDGVRAKTDEFSRCVGVIWGM